MDPIDETWRVNVNRYFKESNALSQIEEGVFLGSIGDASNKDLLKSSNVTHILTVANTLVPRYPNSFVYKVIDVMDREDTNLMQYFDECINFIDEAKRLGGAVLVHCFMGISRRFAIYLENSTGIPVSEVYPSRIRKPRCNLDDYFNWQSVYWLPDAALFFTMRWDWLSTRKHQIVTIVIAYLMKKHGMSFSQALEHVKLRRPQASPNSGFILQLLNFEKSLKAKEDGKTRINVCLSFCWSIFRFFNKK